jgi:hypothetical protein
MSSFASSQSSRSLSLRPRRLASPGVREASTNRCSWKLFDLNAWYQCSTD